MLQQQPLMCAFIALTFVLCLAGPGSAEQTRPAPATTRASDDATARAKSAENLKRFASNAIGFATETNEVRLPKTLYELQASEWRVPPETFMNPRIGSHLPEKIGESREQQAQWVEKNSDYVWGGAGRQLKDLKVDTIIAWEKPDTVKEGIHIVLTDTTVRFVKFPEAHEMIRRGRANPD